MTPLNAIWFDSKKEFVDSLKHSLDASSGDSVHPPYEIRYADQWNDEVKSSIAWKSVDVVLTDVEVAGNSAFDWIRELRQQKANLPVILVSDRSDKATFIQAINSGVNGFVEKPVDIQYLRKLLDRHLAARTGVLLNSERKAIFSQNQWVDLTSTEYKILETLHHAGRRLTRSELQGSVWPNSSISENNLDTHLTNLKRKIPELAKCLSVKRGLGYFLDSKDQ